MEILAGYSLHLGPRCEGAAVKIQIHHNQPTGIHFKVEPSESGYRRGIEKGIRDGVEFYTSNLLKTAAIWVLEIQEHPVDSSEKAFYRAARLAIDQVFSLKHLLNEKEKASL